MNLTINQKTQYLINVNINRTEITSTTGGILRSRDEPDNTLLGSCSSFSSSSSSFSSSFVCFFSLFLLSELDEAGFSGTFEKRGGRASEPDSYDERLGTEND